MILPDEAVLSDGAHIQLLPGVPVEALLKTDDRTPLSYMPGRSPSTSCVCPRKSSWTFPAG